jgi:hypothetical protein
MKYTYHLKHIKAYFFLGMLLDLLILAEDAAMFR